MKEAVKQEDDALKKAKNKMRATDFFSASSSAPSEGAEKRAG